MSKLNLGDYEERLNDFHEIKSPPFTAPLPKSAGLIKPLVSPAIPEDLDLVKSDLHNNSSSHNMPNDLIAVKPNQRCPSPVVPAYANFDIAKRMHYDNLDHQPLPDCIADLAFRKMQIQGGIAGLDLDIDPIATGVGIKTHNAGPTHCTKMKVYRPRTCGVVPKAYNPTADELNRPYSSSQGTKKMGAMDLAIGWDYQPSNPAQEPRRSKHIDGSNNSAGPAVFNCVTTPRDDDATNANVGTGRSAGVFNNTLGEAGFFEKDIMRRKTDFAGRNADLLDACNCGPPARTHSVTRLGSAAIMPSRLQKHYQSTPNLINDTELKRLREKYLGPDDHCPAPATEPACKRSNGGFLRRARSRFCHKVAPAHVERACMHARPVPCKAFRVGVPHYDAAGHFVSSDSGCSSGSNHHGQRVVVVPRPRIPYKKRNYDIDTLVPPFRCYGGGAGEGGYPEHWRLASVYQHAYKPIEQRRRPLLQTVYK